MEQIIQYKAVPIEKVSYSKIDCYKQCPFKYKLRYVDKHFVGGSSLATEFGTLIHETEEAIGKCIRDHQPIDYDSLKLNFRNRTRELADKYPEDFISVDQNGRNYEQRAKEYHNEAIYNLERFMKAHPTCVIVGLEQKFEFAFDRKGRRYVFNGSIDRAIYDTANGILHIQDIKTWPDMKNHGQSAADNSLQFAIYTIAAKFVYGISYNYIRCSYYLPLQGCIEQECRTDTNVLVDSAVNTLHDKFDSIELEDFHPVPSALCHWCEYCNTNPNQPEAGKDLCPYHSTWCTKGDDVKATIVKWKGLQNHATLVEEYRAKVSELERLEGGEIRWQK